MPETPERLANRLDDEGLRSQQFFGALSPAQWERALYTEGTQWTVRQVFAHFVITEVGIRTLMANILTGGDGVQQDFDLNAFNERQVTKWGEIPPDDLLARFSAERRATVEWVRGLAPGDLLKTGRHPWLGVAPLEEMIQLMYRHNQIHQRDIRKLFAEG